LPFAYYRECDYKPIYALRSSFSILIQIPFFLAAYLFLSNHPDLKGLSFRFIKDLGAPDGMINIAGRTFNLLPIIMTVANCISGAIYSKGHPVREKAQIYALAAVFLVILYASPAGLVLYWAMNNILSLVKNIFYKMRHPLRMLYGIFCVVCLGISGYYSKHGTGQKWTIYAIYAISLIIFLIPLWYRLAKWYSATCVGGYVIMTDSGSCCFSLACWANIADWRADTLESDLHFPHGIRQHGTLCQSVGFCGDHHAPGVGVLHHLAGVLVFSFSQKDSAVLCRVFRGCFPWSLDEYLLVPGNYGTVFTDLGFANSDLMKMQGIKNYVNLGLLVGFFVCFPGCSIGGFLGSSLLSW
jgi:hypothetical protein